MRSERKEVILINHKVNEKDRALIYVVRLQLVQKFTENFNLSLMNY